MIADADPVNRRIPGFPSGDDGVGSFTSSAPDNCKKETLSLYLQDMHLTCSSLPAQRKDIKRRNCSNDTSNPIRITLSPGFQKRTKKQLVERHKSFCNTLNRGPVELEHGGVAFGSEDCPQKNKHAHTCTHTHTHTHALQLQYGLDETKQISKLNPKQGMPPKQSISIST